MDVTKPYKSIRFGAMDVTKPYKIDTLCCHGCHHSLSNDRAMDVTKPCEIYTLCCHGCHQVLINLYTLGPWMSPNPLNLYALGRWVSPNLNKFLHFGAMDVAKPYKIYTLWGHGCHQSLLINRAVDVTKPYKFIHVGAMDATNPCKLIGPWMSPNPINLYALGPWMSPNPKN
jgi:hypothetical protein